MKILIIEDEAKLAKSLKQGLEQQGYAADYLLDGESGQRRLEMNQNEYGLVILDVMLPGKDGMTVCNEWRKQKITTPILMLTARDTVNDKITG
ncbi:MAG: response regulator, partial [Patescibacteria group bacterium]|nr:response regulator [Patescibacteria group bacterium]